VHRQKGTRVFAESTKKKEGGKDRRDLLGAKGESKGMVQRQRFLPERSPDHGMEPPRRKEKKVSIHTRSEPCKSARSKLKKRKKKKDDKEVSGTNMLRLVSVTAKKNPLPVHGKGNQRSFVLTVKRVITRSQDDEKKKHRIYQRARSSGGKGRSQVGIPKIRK